MKMPKHGKPANDILSELESFKAHDLPWQDGKVFAYVYDSGPEGNDLLKKAYSMYLSENALDPTVFPSTLKLENDIISMAASLVGGGDDTVGNFTTGGTESIMLAVKTARDYFRKIKPEISQPELVLPHTAHAAFHKACHYLDVKAVVVPVDALTFKAIPSEMEKAITPNTILMVGSAPGYAQGVIDPIPDMAAIAQKHDILFHTDACVGGLFLPFAKKLGYDIPPFDLSVPGVTSLSMDFHKFGYAAKGASAVLYNSRDLRRFQLFAHSGWAGYTIINTTILSSKGGGPLAACWAILHLLGEEGYLRIVKGCMEATQKIIRWTETHDTGLYVLGQTARQPDRYCFQKAQCIPHLRPHAQAGLVSSTTTCQHHFA
jgi:sphinganine-1-phosphate aldolase